MVSPADAVTARVGFPVTFIVAVKLALSSNGALVSKPVMIALKVHVVAIEAGKVITYSSDEPSSKSVFNAICPALPGMKFPSMDISPPSLMPCTNSLYPLAESCVDTSSVSADRDGPPMLVNSAIATADFFSVVPNADFASLIFCTSCRFIHGAISRNRKLCDIVSCLPHKYQFHSHKNSLLLRYLRSLPSFR